MDTDAINRMTLKGLSHGLYALLDEDAGFVQGAADR